MSETSDSDQQAQEPVVSPKAKTVLLPVADGNESAAEESSAAVTLTTAVKTDVEKALRSQSHHARSTGEPNAENMLLSQRDSAANEVAELSEADLEALKVSDKLYDAFLPKVLAGDQLDLDTIRKVLDEPSELSELHQRLFPDERPTQTLRSGKKASGRLAKLTKALLKNEEDSQELVELKENIGRILDAIGEYQSQFDKELGSDSFQKTYAVLMHVMNRLATICTVCEPSIGQEVEVELVNIKDEDERDKARQAALDAAREFSLEELEAVGEEVDAITEFAIDALEVAEEEKAAQQSGQLVGAGSGR